MSAKNDNTIGEPERGARIAKALVLLLFLFSSGVFAASAWAGSPAADKLSSGLLDAGIAANSTPNPILHSPTLLPAPAVKAALSSPLPVERFPLDEELSLPFVDGNASVQANAQSKARPQLESRLVRGGGKEEAQTQLEKMPKRIATPSPEAVDEGEVRVKVSEFAEKIVEQSSRQRNLQRGIEKGVAIAPARKRGGLDEELKLVLKQGREKRKKVVHEWLQKQALSTVGKASKLPAANSVAASSLPNLQEEGIKVIVKAGWDEPLEKVEERIAAAGGKVKGRLELARSVVAELPDRAVEGLAGEFVVAANRKYGAALAEGVPAVKADSAWAGGLDGSGVRIGVLDSGVDSFHEMLQGKVDKEKDFTGSASGARDVFGHGTHIAGIAAGSNASGGYNGVAPGAKIINAKVLNDAGSGSTQSVVQGLQWALDPDGDAMTKDGAQVIVMSFGQASGTPDTVLLEAVKNAVGQGAVVVVASGNCGRSCPSAYCNGFIGVTNPGSSPYAITVGAVDDARQWACFSGGGKVGDETKPDLVAPGVMIASSVPGGYRNASGTSMAVPFVAGAAAIILQKYPGLPPKAVKAVLESTAIDLGEKGKDEKYGSGFLDVLAATRVDSSTLANVTVSAAPKALLNSAIRIKVNSSLPLSSISGRVKTPSQKEITLSFSNSSLLDWNAEFTQTGEKGVYAATVAFGGGTATAFFEAGSQLIEAPETLATNDSTLIRLRYKDFENKSKSVGTWLEITDAVGAEMVSTPPAYQIVPANGELLQEFSWQPNKTGEFWARASFTVEEQEPVVEKARIYAFTPKVLEITGSQAPAEVGKGNYTAFNLSAKNTGGFAVNASIEIMAVLEDKLLKLFSSQPQAIAPGQQANFSAGGAIDLQGGNYAMKTVLVYGDRREAVGSQLSVAAPEALNISTIVALAQVAQTLPVPASPAYCREYAVNTQGEELSFNKIVDSFVDAGSWQNKPANGSIWLVDAPCGKQGKIVESEAWNATFDGELLSSFTLTYNVNDSVAWENKSWSLYYVKEKGKAVQARMHAFLEDFEKYPAGGFANSGKWLVEAGSGAEIRQGAAPHGSKWLYVDSDPDGSYDAVRTADGIIEAGEGYWTASAYSRVDSQPGGNMVMPAWRAVDGIMSYWAMVDGGLGALSGGNFIAVEQPAVYGKWHKLDFSWNLSKASADLYVDGSLNKSGLAKSASAGFSKIVACGGDSKIYCNIDLLRVTKGLFTSEKISTQLGEEKLLASVGQAGEMQFGQEYSFNISVRNTLQPIVSMALGVPLEVKISAQALKNGLLVGRGFGEGGVTSSGQEMGLLLPINFTQRSGRLQLLVRAEYEGRIAEKTINFTVAEKNAPALVQANTGNAFVGAAARLNATLAETSVVSNATFKITSPSSEVFAVPTKTIETGNLTQASAMFFNTSILGSYSVSLEACDELGNCASHPLAPFQVSSCNGKRILLFGSAEFPQATACASHWDNGEVGEPAAGYYQNFDAVVWSEPATPLSGNSLSQLEQYVRAGGRTFFWGGGLAASAYSAGGNSSEIAIQAFENITGVRLQGGFPLQTTPAAFTRTSAHRIFSNFPLEVALGELPTYAFTNNSGTAIAYFNQTPLTAVATNRLGSGKSAFSAFPPAAIANNSLRSAFAANALEWLFETPSAGVKLESLSAKRYFVLDGQPNKLFANLSTGGQPVTARVYWNGELSYSLQASGPFEVGVPTSVGEHEVLVEALGAPEEDYSDNSKKILVRIAPNAPDGRILSIRQVGSRANQASAEISVENRGGAPVNGTLQVSLNGTENALALFIEPGRNATLLAEFNASIGKHPLSARVIAPGEYNETDNQQNAAVYSCDKQNVLVVADDDAVEDGGSAWQSANEFADALGTAGYCTTTRGRNGGGIPTLSNYSLVVWAAGNAWNNSFNDADKQALSQYGGSVLFEGSDLAFDHANDNSTQALIKVRLERDLQSNGSMKLAFNNQTADLLEGLETSEASAIQLNASLAPFPDAVVSAGLTTAENASVAASYDGNYGAIILTKAPTRAFAYYAFAVRAMQPDGARSKIIANTVRWLAQYTTDLTAPNVTTVNSPANQLNSGTQSITFNATVKDNVQLANASIFHNATGIWHRNATNSSLGPAFNNTPILVTVSNLPEGNVTSWVMEACDVAGNCAQYNSNQTLIVDLTAPNVTTVNTVSHLNASSQSVTFSVTVTDNVQLANASIFFNATGTWRRNATNSSLTAIHNNTPILVTASNLPEANRTSWIMEACDVAGNCAQYNANRTFIVDLSAPNVTTVNSPANNLNSSGRSITFNVTVKDNVQLANASIFHNATGIWHRNATNSSLTAIHNNTPILVTVSNLPENNRTSWIMEACDVAGNCEFYNANLTLIVDLAPPNVTTANTAENLNASSQTIVFSVTAKDNAQLANASVYFNATGTWLRNATNGSLGVAYNNTPILVPVSGVPENARFLWAVEACDAVGNCAFYNSNRTAIVDLTAPNVTAVNSPANPLSSSSQTVTFNVTATDNVQLANASIFHNATGVWHRNATNSSLTAIHNNTPILVTVSNLPEGNLASWIAEACDVAGNCAFYNANISLIVDISAPKSQNNQTNSTEAGKATLFSLNFTDNTNLNNFIFSFDNGTGSFTNDSSVAFTGTSNHSNVTKYVNQSPGATIRWIVYGNDSADNLNASATYSFTTPTATPTLTPTPTPQPTATPNPSSTPTPTPTATPAPSLTPTPTPQPTATPTPSSTPASSASVLYSRLGHAPDATPAGSDFNPRWKWCSNKPTGGTCEQLSTSCLETNSVARNANAFTYFEVRGVVKNGKVDYSLSLNATDGAGQVVLWNRASPAFKYATSVRNQRPFARCVAYQIIPRGIAGNWSFNIAFKDNANNKNRLFSSQLQVTCTAATDCRAAMTCSAGICVAPNHSPAAIPTPAPSPSPTSTPTATPTPIPTATPTTSPTPAATPTSTPSLTPSPSSTPTLVPTITPTAMNYSFNSSGLVGWWYFGDEGSAMNNTPDLSGNNSARLGNATAGTQPSLNSNGIIGNSRSFDGIRQFANISNSNSLEFTGSGAIAAWVKPYGQSGEGTIFTRGSDLGIGGWGFYLRTDGAAFTAGVVYTNPATTQIVTKGATPTANNKWQHVVGVWNNGQSLQLYVNGVLEKSTSTNGRTLRTSNTQSLIGSDNNLANNPSTFFNGSINDVKIWNRSLSATEIASLYNASAPTPTPIPSPTATPVPIATSSPSPTPTPVAASAPVLEHKFNGKSYSDVPNAPSLEFSGNGTIYARVRLNQTGGAQTVFQRGTDGPTGGWGFGLKYDGQAFYSTAVYTQPQTSQINAPAASTAQAGQWYNLTAVWRDGAGLDLYVDGQLSATTPTNGKTLRTSGQNSTIGYNKNAGAAEFFSGEIGELRVWNRALTPTEIASL